MCGSDECFDIYSQGLEQKEETAPDIDVGAKHFNSKIWQIQTERNIISVYTHFEVYSWILIERRDSARHDSKEAIF